MFDLKVLELKENMISLINESGLPASVLVYIIKDIADLAETSLREQIQIQVTKKQQEEQALQEQEQNIVMDDIEEN